MAEIKKINTELQLESALRDGNGSPGTNGQVLSSTGTATDWISLSEIQGVDGTGTANYISKWSDTDTITNSIIFDNGTNVGISTASPSQKLDVAGSINLTGNVFSDQGFYGNRLWNSDNTALRFATNNTERMRISSSGNVGVGTTTPTEKLEVAGNVKLDGDNRHIYFGGNNTFIGERSNSTELELRGGGNSSAQTVYIDNSGRIGVGTSNPTNKLQLVYTDTHTSGDLALANSAFDIYNDSTADVAGKGSTLTFSDNYLGTNKTTRAAIKGGTDTAGNTADGFLAFYTDSGGANSMQQRMIIDNDGNVGIGNTNPTKELEIGTNAVAETEFRMHSDVSGNYFNIQSAGNFTSVKTTGSQNFMLDSGGSSGYITLVTNASERMRVNYNGNVGIGTTSPTQKLHIDGNTLISAQRYYYVAGGGTGFGSDASGNFKIRQNGADLIFGSGNNVGIGTTSPGNKLTISGPSSNQFEIINSANSKSWRPNVNGTSFYITESGVSNPFVIQAGGNVGIGTTSPSEKLEVSGNVKVDKGSAPGRTAYLSDDGLYIGRLSAYGGGYPNNIIADPSNSNNLDINARARISLKLNTNTVLIANDSGNVGIGTTSPSTKFHLVGGIARFDNASSNYLEIDGSDSGTNHARISNRFNQLQLVTNAGASAPHIALLPGTGGNVGIGTSSPDAALEVVGGIKLSDNSPLTWATSNTRIIGQSGYMQFQVGATDKMRITSAGNVGIGTTNPSSRLEVVGSYAAVPLKVLRHGDYGNVINIGRNGVSETANIGYPADSTINLSTAGSEKMRITSDGKVGIGTTNPLAKLQVSSTTGWGVFTERGIKDGSTSTYSHSYGAGNAHILGRATIFESSVTFSTLTATSTTKEYRLMNASDKLTLASVVAGVTTEDNILVASGTNIGIGTSNPTTPLHIKNDAPTIRLEDNTSSDNHYLTGNNGEFRVQSTGYITIRPGNTVSTRFDANGNVGIGTTAPSKKLEVNGQTKFYEHSGAHLTNQATSNFNFDTLANNAASYTGGSVGAFIKLTGTPPGATGVWSTFRARAYGENAKGNTSGMMTFFSEYRNYTSTNAVTLGYHAGLYVNPLGVGGLATVTNNYGVYLNPGTAATNNYGVYQNGSSVKNFFQGNVGIGTSSPSEKLEVFGGAAAIKIDSTTNEASLKYDNSTTTANVKLANNDLKTELGGVERMRILANGNVGIGTTSPVSKLNVNGNIKIEGTNQLYFGGSASVPNWEIKAYGSGGNDLLINDTGTNSGDLIFTGQDFGVGTTNPLEKLHVSGEPHPSIRLSSSSDSNYNVVINCGYRNEALNLSVGGYKVFTTEGYNTPETTHLYSNNSKALSLASNQAATFTSTVTATNFINSSDERLKENIEKVCNNSLDVQWKTFEFKSDRGQKRYGVIAQELEKTNPEFVREDAEGFKSVAYIDLLIAKIAELEERIQTLENK